MANINIPIARISDGVALDFFEILMKQFGFNTALVSINGFDPQLNWGTAEVQELKKQDKYTIRQIVAQKAQGASISYQRNAAPAQYVAPDQIQIGNHNNSLSAAELIKINDLISDKFMLAAAQGVTVPVGPESFAAVIASHQEIIGRLERSLEHISERFAEERLKIQTEQDSFIRKKQDEFSERETLLREEVSKEKQALASREKELDDRTNMHARRGIRQDIKNRLQSYDSKFSLTTNTRRMRWSIHAIIGMSLTLLILAIIYYSWEFDKNQSAYSHAVDLAQSLGKAPPSVGLSPYMLLAKSAIATLFAAGILAWYIRWMNRWFEQHADAEFNLKQFELDVDRASWVVETAMEWKTSQSGAIPENLLESISKNLFFRREKSPDEDVHPVDYLASAIFGSAAHAKISIAGNDIELDRKSIRDLKKGD